MGLFDHFPYTNVHELNLDWVLSMMKALEAEWEAFTAGNSLTFADPMLHDISKTYAKNTIVLDGIGNAYVSLQAVPVGVGLQNGDYWLMVFDYEAFIEKVNKNFTANYYRGSYRAASAMAIGDWLTVDDVLYKATAAIAVDDVLEDGVNITHFTLEDFIKAFMQSANQLIQQYKNDIDASELLYRQQLAQDIADTTASLQAQLDAAISGVTVDSEVINARVGADNVTYATLGDAIRTQIENLTKSNKTQSDLTNALFAYEETITPDQTYSNQMYAYSSNTFLSVTNGEVTKVTIDPTKLAYFVSTRGYLGAESAFINYFDSADNFISYEFRLTPTSTALTNQILTIPSGASYFLVNRRGYSTTVYAIDGDVATINDIANEINDALKGNDGTVYSSLGNSIRSQISHLARIAKKQADVTNTLFDYESEVTPDQTYANQMYRYDTGTMISATNSSTKKVIIDPTKLAYFVDTVGYLGSPGAFINYFDSADNFISYEYKMPAVSTTLKNQILDIPSNASYFYVNMRGSGSKIYTIDNNAVTVKAILNMAKSSAQNVDVIQKAIDLGTEVAPDAITNDYIYQYSSNNDVSAAGGAIKKVIIDPDVLGYFVSSSLYAGSTGFPLISYFDSADQQISYEYMNEAGNVVISINQVMLNIPENAAYFLINSRGFNSSIKAYKEGDPALVGKKEISILFVGNSLVQDAISYIPYLIKNYFNEISFKIYIWYNAGYTLAQQYSDFTNNVSCQIFSIAEDQTSWSNHNNEYDMQYVCEHFNFDIVCMEEYFNYKSTYTATDIDTWNDCRDYIASHYTGGNPLEFISFFHAPRRSGGVVISSVYDLTMQGNKMILQDTIAQDMIPCGIATYNAMQTSLSSLGDGGDLTPGDGTHAQEGLPCLIQTYAALCWLLDKLAIPKSIYNCPLRMTTAIYNTLNVPGPNLGNGVVTGTDAENLLAQDVAIKSFKEGKWIVSNNIYSE